MSRRILIISAHPDDETLGCGGTILKHVSYSDEIYWIVSTQAHEPQWSAQIIQKKAEEVEAVAKAFSIRKVFKLGFPTIRLEQVEQGVLMNALREVIEEVKPEIIYTIHSGDVHSDHRALFTATLAVLKPFYMQRLGVKRILSFECLSSTDAAPLTQNTPFVPLVFSDITPFIDRKIEIMHLFESELQPEPAPRSDSAIRALARFRGATINVEYAEAFMLIREIF